MKISRKQQPPPRAVKPSTITAPPRVVKPASPQRVVKPAPAPPPRAIPTPTPPQIQPAPPAKISGPSHVVRDAVKTNTAATQRQALDWFFAHIKGELGADGRAKSSSRRIAHSAFGEKRGMPVIGQMFFFIYDAKLKDELPYWDKFPLVIPIHFYKDGFLGMNLHYLPPMQRAVLLDKLLDYEKSHGTPRAFMKVSYALLKSAISNKLFEPTIHRYLSSHIVTSLVRVDSLYWPKAARMPVQDFQKATAAHVWKKVAK